MSWRYDSGRTCLSVKKDDWAPRIKQGKDTLHKHALEGFNSMPAKGGNSSLSDDEVKAAVDFMANESGAEFLILSRIEKSVPNKVRFFIFDKTNKRRHIKEVNI